MIGLELSTAILSLVGLVLIVVEFKFLWPPRVGYKLFLGYFCFFVASLYAMEDHLGVGGSFLPSLLFVGIWVANALLNFWGYFKWYSYRKQ